MDATNDPALRSWIPVPADSDFPVQNLPYGVFRRDQRTAVATRVGDHVIDLGMLHTAGLLADVPLPDGVFDADGLNGFLALGRPAWSLMRARLSVLLREDTPDLRDDEGLRRQAVIPAGEVTMLLPARIGDYTDFYSSIEHATNMGKMFRDPKNALLPNWRHLPVGYNGRSGSIVVSGTPIRRPCGQTKADDAEAPTYGPSRLVDIELEMGFLTGPATELGTRIAGDATRDHVFGMVLVNDWSARDLQKWEYVPLGPFLGKSFGTSISPWVVTLDALEPFRTAGPEQEPTPLPYLRTEQDWGYDIGLEVWLLAKGETEAVRISRTNFAGMYWTIAQQLAHQTVNGTNVRPGDLYASGTVSGPTPDSYGSLLELTWRGTKPIALPSGAERKFLADGDSIVMRGAAVKDGLRIGFGEVEGTILPADE